MSSSSDVPWCAGNARRHRGVSINAELDTDRERKIEPQHIPWLREFRKAMAAPAEMPEFKGKDAGLMMEKS